MPWLILPLAPHVGFVHLNPSTLQTNVLRHQGSNLLEHAPCGFVGDASLALNLLCRDPAASRAHQKHRMEPDAQARSGFLEDGSSKRIDVIAAMIARIGGTARHTVVLAVSLALLAGRYATRPALLFDVIKAGVIIGKLAVKIGNSVLLIAGNRIASAFHNKNSLPYVLLVKERVRR